MAFQHADNYDSEVALIRKLVNNQADSFSGAQPSYTTASGGSPEDSPATASPVIVGGVARSALPPSTVIPGDAVRLTSSLSAQTIVKPFAVRELDFFVNTVVTTSTQTPLRAAQLGTIIQNVTAITYQNTSATATTLTIQDGTNTLFVVAVAATMASPVQVRFPTPLFGTAATALNYTASVTGASILLNVTGFNSY